MLSVKNKKWIWIGTLTLLFGVGLSWTQLSFSQTELKAREEVQEWLLDPSCKTSPSRISSLLPSTSNWSEASKARISQKLLLQGSASYPEQLLRKNNHLFKLFPHHQSFSLTSVKIAKGEFLGALKEALALQTELEEKIQEARGPHRLYILNLYRIGVLHKKLQNKEEERAIWDQLEALFQNENPLLKESSFCLANSLSSENINLKDYLLKRKGSL